MDPYQQRAHARRENKREERTQELRGRVCKKCTKSIGRTFAGSCPHARRSSTHAAVMANILNLLLDLLVLCSVDRGDGLRRCRTMLCSCFCFAFDSPLRFVSGRCTGLIGNRGTSVSQITLDERVRPWEPELRLEPFQHTSSWRKMRSMSPGKAETPFVVAETT